MCEKEHSWKWFPFKTPSLFSLFPSAGRVAESLRRSPSASQASTQQFNQQSTFNDETNMEAVSFLLQRPGRREQQPASRALLSAGDRRVALLNGVCSVKKSRRVAIVWLREQSEDSDTPQRERHECRGGTKRSVRQRMADSSFRTRNRTND